MFVELLLLSSAAALVSCQEYALPASEVAYGPAQPLVVYITLPDPAVYDYNNNQLPMPYAQAHAQGYKYAQNFCKYGVDEYGNCRALEPVKMCNFGMDRYGNCRTMNPFCPYGIDTYGNCRPKEPTQCLFGTTKLGLCRKEPQKYCPFGEDDTGRCYPQAYHCRFGLDQFGDCIKPPLNQPVPIKI